MPTVINIEKKVVIVVVVTVKIVVVVAVVIVVVGYNQHDPNISTKRHSDTHHYFYVDAGALPESYMNSCVGQFFKVVKG